MKSGVATSVPVAVRPDPPPRYVDLLRKKSDRAGSGTVPHRARAFSARAVTYPVTSPDPSPDGAELDVLNSGSTPLLLLAAPLPTRCNQRRASSDQGGAASRAGAAANDRAEVARSARLHALGRTHAGTAGLEVPGGRVEPASSVTVERDLLFGICTTRARFAAARKWVLPAQPQASGCAAQRCARVRMLVKLDDARSSFCVLS